MDYASISINDEALTHGHRPLPGWDYILTFRDSPPLFLLDRLQQAGFHYAPIHLSDRTLLQLALPHDVMAEKAELLSLRLPLLPRYGSGYLPFRRDRAYAFQNSLHHPRPYFNPAQRVAITLATLRSRDQFGVPINLPRLIRNKIIHSAFVPHAEPERADLLREIGTRWWSPLRVTPLQAARAYFGSTVARYIAWLVFYTRMLTGIAALSIPVYILSRTQEHDQRVLDFLHLSFGLCLCFWCAYWTEYWKRRNAVLNVKWGLVDFYEDNENDLRPDFRGIARNGFYCRGGFVDLSDLHPLNTPASVPLGIESESTLDDDAEPRPVIHIGGGDDPDFALDAPVTGLSFEDLPLMPYSSRKVLKNRLWISAFVTAFFASCVAGLSFSILYYKQNIINLFNVYKFGNAIPGIATALLITVSDPLWKTASAWLTNWENHRTTQSYENSLIRKRFAFQFVSSTLS